MRLYTRSDKPGSKLYAEFQVRNKRYQWSTKTADPAKAAERANEYMQRIIDGEMGLVRKMTSNVTYPTIQQVLDYYEQHALDAKPVSRTRCRNALLRVCKSANIQPSRSLDALTDSTWRTYRSRFVAGLEGEALESAKRTANTVLQQSRAVFSRSMMRQYKAHFKLLPDLAGWLDMEFFRAPHPGFQAVPMEVLQRVVVDAKTAGPAYHVAVLLSLFGGLRYNEVQQAQWSWLTEREDGTALIRIPAEHAKSNRARVVPLSADVLADLKAYRKPDWPYISPKTCRLFGTHLTAMLHKAGITSRKGCHELRKQFGAMVATRSGLYVAQKLLGHSNPGLTSKIYADLISMPSPLETTVALGLASHKSPSAPAPAPQPPERCGPGTSCSPTSDRPELRLVESSS